MNKLCLDARIGSGESVKNWPAILMPGHDQLTTEPTREIVHNYAKNYTQRYPAIINLEHWPLPQKMQNYIDVIDWWHEARPDVRVGYYSLIPQREYWAPIVESLGQNPEYVTWWKQQNAALARMRDTTGKFAPRGLADVVDFICPSLYTFYTDKQSGPEYSHDAWWEVYAIANIEAARQYQKQVYPFLWPRFHDSNTVAGLQYIGDELFQRQIEICLKYADGCVIWDSPELPNAENVLQKSSKVMADFS